MILSRRSVLLAMAATGAALTSGVAHADVDEGDKRLVLLILRGGMDGLAAVPPHGDMAYPRARGKMALPAKEILDLDGTFGLHPSMAPLLPLWQAGELSAVHATALPYSERSHFDAQDLLENGTSKPQGATDGWLNRALQALGGRQSVAMGRQVPLVLRGDAEAASVDPFHDTKARDGFLDQVASLYSDDPLLAGALAAGRDTRAMLDERSEPMGRRSRSRRAARGPGAARRLAAATGTLLSAGGGPGVAVLELGGWDTHANQGTTRGGLAGKLGALAEGIVALKAGLQPVWKNTVVVVVTEFGRTVHANGTGGTDHGVGGVALLAGGAIAGGKVVSDWPGLSQRDLLAGRDLRPTTDLRSVFKGVLQDHLGVSTAALDGTVFPDSKDAKPLRDLIA